MPRRKSTMAGSGKPESHRSSSLRRQAEKILAEEGFVGMRPADVEKLVHELQVHQIELEMQNEELKGAQSEIAESREMYVDLYDFAPVAYFSFDQNGLITGMNLPAASLIGLERSRVIGTPFSLFISPSYRDIFSAHRHKTQGASQAERCELLMQRKGGSAVPVLMESMPVSDETGHVTIRSAVTDITDRKKMENELRRYQLLARHSRDIILFVRRADGGIVEANDAAARAYGYSREELLSLKIYNLRGPEGYSLTDSQMDAGDSSDILFETEHRRKDGTTFPVEVSSRGISIDDERVLLSVIRDITERKQAEEAARKASHRVVEILESIGDAFFSLDENLVFTYFNAAAERHLARDRQDVIGKPFQEAFPEAAGSIFHLNYARAVREKMALAFEAYFEDPPYENWYDVRVYPRGEGISVFFQVVTERKRMEEALGKARGELELRVQERTAELQEARGKLVEQSRILESFFTSTITPLVFLDRDFNFIRVNEAYAKACKKKIGDFQGHNYFENYPHEENEAIFRKVVETRVPYQATAKPFAFPDHPEWGTTYWDWTLTPLLNELEEVEFLVFSLEDVTEQQRAEQQLRQTQKMEAMGTLAGGIAHDFNNMLAVIIGNAELALDDLDGNGEPERNIKQVIKASRRAVDLVKQILAFSRKTEQERKPLKLTPLIKETYKFLRSSLPSTVDMKLDLRTTSDTINGDPSQIQQVLMNLSTNAAHAMREKGGTLVISLSRVTFTHREKMPEADMAPGTYVKLSVRDTGTGMTEDVQKRMFEPFFTTKEAGQGTGMGLAVVYGIVKSHGGAISVQSSAGGGSTFIIFLPCADVTAKEGQEEAGAVPGGKERILFVDDEPAIVEMASHMLRRLGYDVTAASSPPNALNTFLKEPGCFDLVITDHTMPELTGIDLARRMLEVRKDLPIILVTGHSEVVSPEKAKSVGIREFVMKPLFRRQLAETVRAVLDGTKVGV